MVGKSEASHTDLPASCHDEPLRAAASVSAISASYRSRPRGVSAIPRDSTSPPAVVMLMLSHFIRALRWQILIEPLGYKPGVTNTFLAVMVGYWVNLAVPRLGEVLKCTILARYEKVPADKLVGTIVAERAIDVLSLIIILLITIFSQYDTIGNFSAGIFSNFFASKTGSFSMLKVVIVLAIISFIVLIIWMLRKLSHLPFIGKNLEKCFPRHLAGTDQHPLYQTQRIIYFPFCSYMGLYLLSTYMGFFAMRDLLQYGIKGALSALTFGSFGMIIPSPGGIGSFSIRHSAGNDIIWSYS